MKRAWKTIALLFVVGLVGINPAWSLSVFYNLKKKTDVRFSPSQESPVKFSLYRKLPIKIIRKYQDWCFIQESEGEQGWVPENMVFQGSMVLVTKNTFLKREKDSTSSSLTLFSKIISVFKSIFLKKEKESDFSNLAQISKGVLVKLKECQGTMCLVETKIGRKTLKGWVSREALWGIA